MTDGDSPRSARLLGRLVSRQDDFSRRSIEVADLSSAQLARPRARQSQRQIDRPEINGSVFQDLLCLLLRWKSVTFTATRLLQFAGDRPGQQLLIDQPCLEEIERNDV